MKIYKYRLEDDRGQQSIKLPKGAQILSVAMQEGQGLMVWAKVNLKAPIVERVFHIVPTGGSTPEVSNFIGTVFTGPFVWHVFIEREPYEWSL